MADAHSPSDAPQRLTAIRGEIDSVDQELLALFNRRAALSQMCIRDRSSTWCSSEVPWARAAPMQ